jgi:hypothetical protein
MKRIVILIDGTWNKEGITGNTNVAALDPGNRISGGAFIKTTAATVSRSTCIITTASAARFSRYEFRRSCRGGIARGRGG